MAVSEWANIRGNEFVLRDRILIQITRSGSESDGLVCLVVLPVVEDEWVFYQIML